MTGRNAQGILGFNLNQQIAFLHEPKVIPTFTARLPIDGISAGLYHVLAWSQSGKLFSWGRSTDGCLGYFDPSNGTQS